MSLIRTRWQKCELVVWATGCLCKHTEKEKNCRDPESWMQTGETDRRTDGGEAKDRSTSITKELCWGKQKHLSWSGRHENGSIVWSCRDKSFKCQRIEDISWNIQRCQSCQPRLLVKSFWNLLAHTKKTCHINLVNWKRWICVRLGNWVSGWLGGLEVEEKPFE